MNSNSVKAKILREKGLNYSEIGKKLGLSRQYIHAILNKATTSLSPNKREFIFKRDKYTCQWRLKCKKDYPVDRKDLNVHHIDMDRSNNLATNLITLCRTCHVAFHSLQRPKKPKKVNKRLPEYKTVIVKTIDGKSRVEKHGDHCVRCKKKRDDTTTETIRAYDKKVHNNVLYVYYMCRDCNNARHRVYAKTPHGRKACYRASKKYNKNHPDKIKEWKKNRKKGII